MAISQAVPGIDFIGEQPRFCKIGGFAVKKENVRLSELAGKRAVSIKTGEYLGRIRDVGIDTTCGTVTDAVVLRRRGLLGFFGGGERLVSWKNICLVGEDTVLIDAEGSKDADCAPDGNGFGLFG